MVNNAENKIKEYANKIIENFKTTKYKDKLIAISDYQKDCKNFSNLPQKFYFKTKASNAHKELAKRLIIGYNNLPTDIKKQFKQEFFANVEKRCPFCGQLLESSGKSKSDVPTADLDHFFPKFEYPQFALLPQNLIPTCMECNRIEKHINHITPREFKQALENLNLLKEFQKHPKSHFKIFPALECNMNNLKIIECKTQEIEKLVNLFSLQERYTNIKEKCFNVLISIIKNFGIRSPEALEQLLENIAASNWHEVNDGYSLNNSPQIWQEFIENILYDECKLMALWDEVKSMNSFYIR